jgi:ABC-type polysaccharide/polyol phosphate transport system ATPase subunit
MIELENVNKSYRTRSGKTDVLKDVSFRVMPGEKIAILGRNGAGKSTMVRLLSGAERPDSGRVTRNMTVSWPLAFGGAFQTSLTGIDNLRFICRIYGVDPTGKQDYVDSFSELGKYLQEPVRNYSSGMRARLAFAISMVIEFDCFLIDEVVSVGDARFHEKCHEELFVKRSERAMIIVSHDAGYIREHCSTIGILHNGGLKMFNDLDEGYAYYRDVYN